MLLAPVVRLYPAHKPIAISLSPVTQAPLHPAPAFVPMKTQTSLPEALIPA